VGPILFTAVYTIEGIGRPGYDATRRPISDLSVGPGGWVQIANFIVLGTLVLGLAVALRHGPSPLSRSRWLSRLIALFGIGLLAAGIFVTDPAPGYPPGSVKTAITFHGAMHQVASLIAFNALPVACYVTAWHLWRSGTWRGFSIYSVASGVLMMATLAGFGFAMASGGPAGIFERCAGSIGLAWLILTSARLAAGPMEQTPNTAL
jgi:hypothetical membrane protein